MYSYCHKCSGLLAASADMNLRGLHGCGCISSGSYPQTAKTRLELLLIQANQCITWIELYIGQKREMSYLEPQFKAYNRALSEIMNSL